MTAPTFEGLLAALARGSAKLEGREGAAIRAHLDALAKILAAGGDDAVSRKRAAGELDQLITAIGAASGPVGKAFRGVELFQLTDGLRTFASWLRAPSAAGEAQVAELVQRMNGPVPLDELRVDGQVEQLAIEAARRQGLEGAAARHAVERMKREMQSLVSRLEGRAREEASRAKTANDFSELLDQVVARIRLKHDSLRTERS